MAIGGYKRSRPVWVSTILGGVGLAIGILILGHTNIERLVTGSLSSPQNDRAWLSLPLCMAAAGAYSGLWLTNAISTKIYLRAIIIFAAFEFIFMEIVWPLLAGAWPAGRG